MRLKYQSYVNLRQVLRAGILSTENIKENFKCLIKLEVKHLDKINLFNFKDSSREADHKINEMMDSSRKLCNFLNFFTFLCLFHVIPLR